MRKLICMGALALLTCGCATVDVTKTSKGFTAATDPNEVEILMTRPEKHFTELGAISASGFSRDETAKMHNALRAKAAPLGANAVIITASGQVPDGWGGMKMWINGVAIRWN